MEGEQQHLKMAVSPENMLTAHDFAMPRQMRATLKEDNGEKGTGSPQQAAGSCPHEHTSAVLSTCFENT